ncbi:MAG: efflux RND transporter periplasmic adaptor subunit [Acidobacteriia bacterium]|nr:efflux RND transporter periplasmic adaptor subunit [Terriglobia bacterium]
MAKKKSRRVIIVVISVLAVAGLAVVAYSAKSHGKSTIDPSRLAAVERGDLARSVVATGRIEPISKVEIKSKANGIIKELKVDVGDLVSVGQVLAELDKDNLEAQLRQARAAMLSSEANLKAAVAQLEKNKIEAEGPDVPFARRNKERAERLNKDGLITQQALDDARSALDMAVNRQNAASSQLSISQARIAQAKADVAQAQANVDRAQEELSYSTIRSPIRGMVLSRDVEVGSPVSSILNMGAQATLVMVLGDISQVFVRGKVDEADIGMVRLNQPARIKVETFKEKQFEGRVTRISPLGVEKDNVISFEVRVSINNPGGELRANMTANAEIVLEEHKGTLIVPESAIIYDAQHKAWVEVASTSVRMGRERKPIKVGVSNGTRTEVSEGVALGEKVILQ